MDYSPASLVHSKLIVDSPSGQLRELAVSFLPQKSSAVRKLLWFVVLPDVRSQKLAQLIALSQNISLILSSSPSLDAQLPTIIGFSRYLDVCFLTVADAILELAQTEALLPPSVPDRSTELLNYSGFEPHLGVPLPAEFDAIPMLEEREAPLPGTAPENHRVLPNYPRLPRIFEIKDIPPALNIVFEISREA